MTQNIKNNVYNIHNFPHEYTTAHEFNFSL